MNLILSIHIVEGILLDFIEQWENLGKIIEKTRIPLDPGRALLCEGYLWKEWCERHPSVAQWGIGEPGEPSAN